MRDKPGQRHAQIGILQQRTLRTAESTNLHATHIAFSNIERFPRACGACTMPAVSLDLEGAHPSLVESKALWVVHCS